MTVLDKNRFLLKYNLKSLSAMTKRHFSHEGLISITFCVLRTASRKLSLPPAIIFLLVMVRFSFSHSGTQGARQNVSTENGL